MLRRALISVCLALSLASCAGAPATPDTVKSPVAAGAAPASGCPRSSSATRTAASAVNCSGAKSVYSRGDIDRTGEATVGGALQNPLQI